MSNERKKLFKKFEKEHYTILVPDMCPIHFDLLTHCLEKDGMHMVIVTPQGPAAKEEGLASIHNDACYPALITCGAFVDALKTGQYDLNKTAVIMSQTGGGCRASNYISLFRKAFEKEFPTVPVLSLNFSGLEKERSLPLTLRRSLEFLHCVVYGDFLMNLVNQSRPYYGEEKVNETLNCCLEYLHRQIGHQAFYQRKKNYRYLLSRFKPLEPPEKRKPRVGIVGEIFVKYSPYANNHLKDFLISQNTEVVEPSLSEFVLYCIYNLINDHTLYGMNHLLNGLYKKAYKIALKETRIAAKALEGTRFEPFEDFAEIVENAPEVISTGVKMGEGWLIPAEMVSFAKGDKVKNIVVVQPFGCLPNHIVGKGMIRPVKERYPEENIVPLDFDASSTQVNQENRLKLMLANLKD